MRAFRLISGLVAAFSLLSAPIAADARARQLRPGLRLISTGTVVTTPPVTTPTPDPVAIPRDDQRVASWDADQLTSKADGAAMTTWTDTINGAVLTAIGGPTYRTNVEGTHGAVRFVGGGSQRMEASNASALTAALDSRNYTVLITLKNVGNTGGFGTAFSASAGGDSIIYVADTGTVGRYNNSLNTQAPWSSPALVTIGSSTTTTGIGAASNGYERNFVQGGVVAVVPAPAPGTQGNTITIGNLANAAGGGYFGFAGDILRVDVWKVTLTPTQVLSYQRFINAKYSKPDAWIAAGKFTIFAGDSITAGVGLESNENTSGTYPYKAAQTLNLPYGTWSNLGIGGMKYSDMASLAPTEIDNVAAVTGVNTHLATFEYVNEQNSGADAPTIIANARSYLQARAAAGVSKITFGTSTSFAQEGQSRSDYNTYWAANGLTYAQRLVNIHTNSQIGVNGTFNNSPPFSGDKVHLLSSGNTALAGLMSAQMSTLAN